MEGSCKSSSAWAQLLLNNQFCNSNTVYSKQEFYIPFSDFNVDMLEFLTPKSTRIFQVKPVFLVNENHNSEHLSRPTKLSTLVIKKLSRLFTRNHEIFVQNHALEIIQCLPPELRNEIFNAIEKISVYQPNYPADNVFKAWQMLFSGDKLVLKEFLGHHWSKLLFSYLVNSSKVFEDINQLVLQSNEINQVMRNFKKGVFLIMFCFTLSGSGASLFPF